MPTQQSKDFLTKNYFISIDFFLRTVLFLITIVLLILQHTVRICTTQSRFYLSEYFYPSFGTNSWSAMGLYLTCWVILILYFHTILLVFMDNFQIQFHATTYVILDMITSIFFLSWTTVNIVQLSNCSHQQLAANQTLTQQNSIESNCTKTPCSIYLAPSVLSFIAMFTAIGLAASAFGKINFYKIPRYLRDYDTVRSTNDLPLEKPFDTLSNAEGKQFADHGSNRSGFSK